MQAFTGGVGKAAHLVKENEVLQSKLFEQKNDSEKLTSLQEQNDELRKLINLPSIGKEKVYAEVISLMEYDNRITISAGSNKGIKADTPVITVHGLLGVVSTVEEKTSQVLLISSPSFKISGLIEMEPLVPGIVRGSSRTRMFMDVLDEVDVKIGSKVVTTGYSENIPRGLLVGVVSEFYKDEEFGTRRATVIPSAKIGLTKEVIVLK